MAITMSFEGIASVMGWRVLVMQLYSLMLDISEDKWSKNFPMSGENMMHMRHVKTAPKKKTSRPPYTS